MGNCCVVEEKQSEIHADVKIGYTQTFGETNNNKLQFRAVNMNRNFENDNVEDQQKESNLREKEVSVEYNNTLSADDDEIVYQTMTNKPKLFEQSKKDEGQKFNNSNSTSVTRSNKPEVQLTTKVDTKETLVTKEDEEMQAKLKKEENIKMKKSLIEDFYTERLRAAEKRAGPFDIPNNQRRYGVSASKLLEIRENPNLLETDLVIIDKDAIYWGQVNKFGHREGYGILLKRGGIKTEGYWETNHLEVYGRHINESGLVSEGAYTNAELNGDGMESSETYEFEGKFENGIKQGYGEYTSKKDIYKGNFDQGKRNGKGHLIMLPDKHEYRGDFVSGRLDGKGNFKWSYGDVYEGDFKKNKLNGSGVYTWKNGDIYVGNYVDGNKVGFGKMVWRDGKVYEGEFVNNKPKK